MVLANLHLRELQASDARDEFRFHERLAVRMAAVALALTAIVAYAALSAWPMPTKLAVIAVGFAKAIESFADLGYGMLQVRERFAAIATAQAVRGFCGLVLAAVTFFWLHEVAWAIVGMAIGWLCVVLVFDLPRVAAASAPDPLRPTINRPRLRALLRQALPMGVVSGIGTITLMFPSYLIQNHLGTSDLGHYTAVLSLLLIGNVAALALGQAASPRLARAFVSGDRSGFLRLVGRLCLATAGLGVLAILTAWLLGAVILELVYGTAWRTQAPLLVWLAGAAAIQWLATALGFAMTAARRLTIQVPIAILACGVSGVSSWWLVGMAGLIGAAWSGMVTCVLFLVCHSALVLFAKPSPGAPRP
jgi:O-antigen/teichoic acid export membrane protein